MRGAGTPPRHRPGRLTRRRLHWPAVALANFRLRPRPHYTHQRISDLGWLFDTPAPVPRRFRRSLSPGRHGHAGMCAVQCSAPCRTVPCRAVPCRAWGWVSRGCRAGMVGWCGCGRVLAPLLVRASGARACRHTGVRTYVGIFVGVYMSVCLSLSVRMCEYLSMHASSACLPSNVGSPGPCTFFRLISLHDGFQCRPSAAPSCPETGIWRPG